MKLISEFGWEIKDNERLTLDEKEKAIAALKRLLSDEAETNINVRADNLSGLFYFSDTLEGHTFWRTIACALGEEGHCFDEGKVRKLK